MAKVHLYPAPDGTYLGGIRAVERIVDKPVADVLVKSGAFTTHGTATEAALPADDDGDIRLHLPQLYESATQTPEEPAEPVEA